MKGGGGILGKKENHHLVLLKCIPPAWRFNMKLIFLNYIMVCGMQAGIGFGSPRGVF